MPFPFGSRSASVSPRETTRPKNGPVLAVGSRAIVAASGSSRVPLTDHSGENTVAMLTGDSEVEIIAWQPQRAGSTRYHVRPVGGTTEGWVPAASLKARVVVVPPPPPPAAKPVAAAPVAKPTAAATVQRPRSVSTPARQPPARARAASASAKRVVGKRKS